MLLIGDDQAGDGLEGTHALIAGIRGAEVEQRVAFRGVFHEFMERKRWG